MTYSRWSSHPVTILLTLVATFALLDIRTVFDPPYLLPLLNTLFLGLMPLIAAYVASGVFLATGYPSILLLGCGVIALGFGGLVSGWFIGSPGGPNTAVTIYNSGALLSSMLHAASMVLALNRYGWYQVRNRRNTLTMAYAGVMGIAFVFFLAAVKELTPPFIKQGLGPTPVGHGVIGLAIFFFSISFLLGFQYYRRTRVTFIRWYTLGLALIPIGLIGSYLQKAVGSPIGWIGRSGQYLGALYILIGVLIFYKATRRHDWGIAEAIATIFREAEASYRTLSEAVNDGVVSIDQNGRVLMWNQGAEKLFGYGRQEVTGRNVNDFFVSESSSSGENACRIEERAPGRIEGFGLTKDGRKFTAEFSVSRWSGSTGPITTCIIQDISARKQAEEELFASNQRLAALMNSLPVGVSFSDDITCKLITGNPVLLEQFEITTADNVSASSPDPTAAGRRIRYFLEGRELNDADLPLQRAVAENRKIPLMELEVHLPSGKRWIAAVSGAPIRNQAGEVIGGVAVTMDITERKRMEMTVRENEAILRGILDSVMESIWMFDAQGTVLLANAIAFQRFPLPPEKVIGRTMAEILPADLARSRMSWLREVLESARPLEFEDQRDGILFRHTYYPILDGPGVVKAVISFSRDITESRRAEVSLRESQEDLARAQEVGQIGSWRLDVRRNVLVWSDENHRIFGVPKGTPLTYETFLGIVHPDDRRHVDTLWRTGPGGEPYDIEHRLLVDGEVKWVREKAYLEFDPEGNLLGAFGITQDISKQKAAEEALKGLLDVLEQRVEERTVEARQAWETLRYLTAKLISAEEFQRKNTARDIHDTLGSCLSGIKFKLEDIIHQIGDPKNEVAGKLSNLIPWIQEAIKDCRRIQTDLSPVMLTDLGLLPTISWLLRRFNSIYSQVQVTSVLEVKEAEIPEHLKIVIYRVLQEALNNIGKHSETDRIVLELKKDHEGLLLVIHDFGKGFDVNAVRNILGASGGLGLSSMRERVEGSAGQFNLHSTIGAGTKISARWKIKNPMGGPVS